MDQVVEAAINAWADKHDLQPAFYSVTNAKEIRVELLDEEGNYKILAV